MGKTENGVPEHGECDVDNVTLLAPKTVEITRL